MRKKVAFYTLGCKLNFSETSTIARQFVQEGFDRVDFTDEADIYVINTCSVTENADKRFKTIVKQAQNKNPHAFIAAVGLPGTAGFVAELHVMIGSFKHWGWIVLVLSFGVIISATYAVRTIKQLFTGPSNASMKNIEDLKTIEVLAAAVLVSMILVFGFYPAPLLDLITPTITNFVSATQLAH